MNTDGNALIPTIMISVSALVSSGFLLQAWRSGRKAKSQRTEVKTRATLAVEMPSAYVKAEPATVGNLALGATAYIPTYGVAINNEGRTFINKFTQIELPPKVRTIKLMRETDGVRMWILKSETAPPIFTRMDLPVVGDSFIPVIEIVVESEDSGV